MSVPNPFAISLDNFITMDDKNAMEMLTSIPQTELVDCLTQASLLSKQTIGHQVATTRNHHSVFFHASSLS